jgi:pimeloyl-ACP methyl ester carboxylesterase
VQRRLRFGLVVVLAVAMAACASDDAGDGATPTSTTTDGTDARPPIDDEVALPIVFVHGFAGSAQQYESQAMRFVANGYPQDRIVAYDHDGAGMDIEAYTAGVSEVVDRALDEFDVEQVYLVGHSRGTFVSTAYLRDPANASKVAKYIALDGAACPEAVPCIAPDQAGHPGQSHVEVATSPESFAEQFEFLVGEAPEVVDIVPQAEPVEISGRAVNFPANTGRQGTLDIWAVDPDTGQRQGRAPHASFTLGTEGEFGPVEFETGAHYEYAISSDDTPVVHHLYLQPYLRSSHLVRLLSSGPDGATRMNTNTGDDHAAVIAIRMREWYATDDTDLDGDQRDVLEVGVRGDADPVDVLEDYVGNATIGLHIHDDAASPGETTLVGLPYFSTQPFQSGIDVFLPASPTGEGTITVSNVPRGDRQRVQTLNVPNWPSATNAISVVFTDSPVD